MSKPRQVVITRPAGAAADETAQRVAALGWEPLSEPLLQIKNLEFTVPDLSSYTGLVFTSARALAFFPLPPNLNIPVYAVGDATARAARQAGFSKVYDAGGDVAALNRFLSGRAEQKKGRLLHVCGADIAREVTAGGITVERLVVYKAEPAETFSDAFRQSLKAGNVAAILFFSPRTAEAFRILAEKEVAKDKFSVINALCISPAVLECLHDMKWREILAAQSPDQDAVMELLGAFTREG